MDNISFMHVPHLSYTELRAHIHSGDILLASGNSPFSVLIQNSTQSLWSHVAFVLRLDEIDRIMILESVESIGVRTVPLSNYIFDYNATGKGYPGKLLIARHCDVQQKNMIKLSRFATSLLGYPYNTEEIIRIAMRIGLSKAHLPLPKPDTITKRGFICSEYVYICFESIGIKIPFDSLGFIAPSDFAHCKKIHAIGSIQPSQIPPFSSSKKMLEKA